MFNNTRLQTWYSELNDRLPTVRRLEATAHLASWVAVSLTALMVGTAMATESNPVSRFLIETLGMRGFGVLTAVLVSALYRLVNQHGDSVIGSIAAGALALDALGNVWGVWQAGLPESAPWADLATTSVLIGATAVACYYRLSRVVTARSSQVNRRAVAKATLAAAIVILSSGAPFAGPSLEPVGTAQAAEGDTDWSTEAGGPPGSATVVDGTVYVVTESNTIEAYDQATGTQQWTYNAGSSYFQITNGPAVSDGVVYAGDNGGTLYAIDADTGNQEWATNTGGKIHGSPTVKNGLVYTDSGNSAKAYDTSTGSEEWSYTTGNSVRNSPLVYDGKVYFGSYDGSFYAVDSTTGSLEWEQSSTGILAKGGATISDGTLYFGSDDSNLYALDPSNGNIKWSFSTGSGIRSIPNVANGSVFVHSDDKNVYAVDPDTGNQQWSSNIGGAAGSSPAYANGTVYIGSGDGSVYALDANTGNQQWSKSLASTVPATPTIASGTMYVGAGFSPGSVYAIDTSHTETQSGSHSDFNTLGHVGSAYGPASGSATDPRKDVTVTVDDRTELDQFENPRSVRFQSSFNYDGDDSAFARFNGDDQVVVSLDKDVPTYEYTLISESGAIFEQSTGFREGYLPDTWTLEPGKWQELNDGAAITNGTKAILASVNNQNQSIQNATSVVMNTDEPVREFNFTIRDDSGEPVYNDTREFDEPTTYYERQLPANATNGTAADEGYSLDYGGTYENGTTFSGEADYSGEIAGGAFGPTGGGGGGGSPIVGVAIVGGVGYLAYRRFGSGQLGETVSSAARRLGP